MSDPATTRLSPAERKELLRLAREAIGAALGRCAEPDWRLRTPALEAPGGAFVTLHRDGMLRGCIGTVHADRPLAETVVRMAKAAAFEDPRFPPVAPEEWPRLEIEISRLSPLRRIRPEDLVPGRHGCYVVCGPARGLLLPQVAARLGWSREEFLRETCRKAGCPPEAWRDPRTEIYAFEAEIFADSEPQAGDARA